ncbi:hypothetical protein K505DRAFT_282758 [Melanomma pulvis-pyrius CBS 109.77]|uniref:Uncharacterized protein n=1 Tax=Melanomma pulvis-pyrius CBS 109.77 TaxID=1314802 RepID=A0A6A6X340_9PLEO|nr:hypothetical protein K505DRAFT_282758 [Melanomma pulvis-pyrius CBS 109.77]
MATNPQHRQLGLWAAGTDFVLDVDASAKREFARLAKTRGWTGGDEEWNKHWLLCFGESYTYVPPRKSSTPSPIQQQQHSIKYSLPLEALKAKPILSPEFVMSPNATDPEQEFFRDCHRSGDPVHGKRWRNKWKQCFGQFWSLDQFGRWQEKGPASKLQRMCFGVYEGFTLVKDADVIQEFARLRREMQWSRDTCLKESKWCFGSYLGPNICIQTFRSDSDSSSISGWGSDSGSESGHTVYTPSHSDDGGISLPAHSDPTVALSDGFKRLDIDQDNSSKSEIQRRAEAYAEDFGTLLGTDPKKLETWQKLCNILDIEPTPQSVTQCKKSYSRVWVNLYNLIGHLRDPDTVPLRSFKSYGEFSKYTKRAGHVFPKTAAKKNAFLKALLHRIF